MARISLDDFLRLYPEEFTAIAEAWSRQREYEDHGAWERMRILACISVQPHVKKKVTPKQLLPFPWDNRKPDRPKEPKLTKEKRKERLEKLVERLKD